MTRPASFFRLRWFCLSVAFPLALACGNKQTGDDDGVAGTGGSGASGGQGGTAGSAGRAPGGAPGTGGTTGGSAGTGATGAGGAGGTTSTGGSAGTSVQTGGAGGSLAGTGGSAGSMIGGSGGAGVAGQASGSGGNLQAGQGGAAGTTSMAGAGGAAGGGVAGAGAAGGAATGFFRDDFEGGTAGQQPPGWDNFIAYVKNNMNPSGTTLALVDTMHVHGGTKAVHFHGDSNPAQIVKSLPSGMTKLYVRAWFYMTRKLGQQTDMSANHESLVVLRRLSGMASDEVRFGEIKGTVGVNEVPTDNIAPTMDKWHQATGPVVAANAWSCIEVAFLADASPNTLKSWQNGSTLFDVTSVGTDQWQNSTMAPDWLAKKFGGTPAEIVLGWQSFSSAANDVWMDDLVLSTSPIGCN